MTTQAPAGRRRLLPRMRLATLLVLIAVVGCSAGWLRSVRVQRQAVQALRDAGADVTYDWEWEWAPEWDPTVSFRSGDKELSGWRRTLAERFGPDAVASVAAVSLPESSWIHEDNRGATDEHIELLGRLKSLRELELSTFTVTEAGAAPIAGLKQLRTFVASDPSGKSEVGPILSRFGEGSRLQRLILSNVAIDHEDFIAISRLSRLEHLLIEESSGEIDDADLAKLAGLGRLKILDLPHTRITPEGLGSIGRMKSLESLSFEESAVDDLAPLLQLPALQSLDLGYGQVGDEGISALGKMPALRSFSLASNSLTDAGLARLRNAPALEELTLYSDFITADGLASLAAIKTLERITIWGAAITPEEHDEFVEAHPGIDLMCNAM